MALEILTKEENLYKNVEVLRSKSRDGKLSVVVGANAFGHGMLNIALLLEDDVDCFIVESDGEVDLLRRIGIQKPVELSHLDYTSRFEVRKQRGLEDISLYGYPRGDYLPVREIYSKVLDVKKLPPNFPLGRCVVGDRGVNVATIVGGYIDGFGSDFIGAHLLIAGKTYPILAVSNCFTLLKVDDRVNIGDKVCICGTSGDSHRYLDELALEVGVDVRELMLRFGRNGKD